MRKPISKPSKNPLLVVVSGPSGVGKDAVLSRMKQLDDSPKYMITTTTRPKRSSETDGKDYHFTSKKDFEEMIAHNELLEWANVYGNYYGVPKKPIKESLSGGSDTILKVDVQGVATIKKILPQAVFIFLMPPSMEELSQRLKQRKTETPEAYAHRLETAEQEMKKLKLFDYIVVNYENEIDLAVKEILAIIKAEKHHESPRIIEF